MKMNEILDNIKMLANSQGFYGRLYRDLMDIKAENPDEYNEIVKQLESQNFGSTLDLIMYLEG